MRAVKEGWEDVYENIVLKKKSLEEDKAREKEEACKKIDEHYEERAKTIEELLIRVSDEIPDEEAESLKEDSQETEEVESTENTPVEEETQTESETTEGDM